MSLPSQLVEQRPDVRQAEENLHSASAQIGIAVANRLPNFALTADAGSMALSLARSSREAPDFGMSAQAWRSPSLKAVLSYTGSAPQKPLIRRPPNNIAALS